MAAVGIFAGSVNSTGYGIVGAGRKGKTVLAHRLVVIARDGAIPEGMTVDHHCHNSYVCGWSHLPSSAVRQPRTPRGDDDRREQRSKVGARDLPQGSSVVGAHQWVSPLPDMLGRVFGSLARGSSRSPPQAPGISRSARNAIRSQRAGPGA